MFILICSFNPIESNRFESNAFQSTCYRLETKTHTKKHTHTHSHTYNWVFDCPLPLELHQFWLSITCGSHNTFRYIFRAVFLSHLVERAFYLSLYTSFYVCFFFHSHSRVLWYEMVFDVLNFSSGIHIHMHPAKTNVNKTTILKNFSIVDDCNFFFRMLVCGFFHSFSL